MAFVELSVTVAIILTVLFVIYKFTIGALTDAIPIIGLADDALFFLVVVFAWVSVLLVTLVANPLMWALGAIIILGYFEVKTNFISKLIGGRKK